MVLLHGLPGRWQEFLPLLPALSLQWHIYALDFRGQGKSSWVPGQYPLKYYVMDVKQFVRKQLDEPAVIFGLSAGGAVALAVAAEDPELTRAIIVGDSPVDLDKTIPWMESEAFKYWFSSLRQLAGLDLTSREIAKRISAIPVQIPGQNETMRYDDLPDVDQIQILEQAITLSTMDPDVLKYHAEGRATEFSEGFVLDKILGGISCPILLLQSNPALGGMMTDKVIRQVQSVIPQTMHVLIEKDHGLGMDTWEVAPLIRAVTDFLNTL
jgi:pimeloyl-ACP methyl ester carboxylesterase